MLSCRKTSQKRFADSSWHEYPLTADKYVSWIAQSPKEEQITNIFLNYEALGDSNPRETGIFDFFRAIPRFAAENGIEFWTPSEAVSKLKPVDIISVTHPISGADEARDTSAWLGNQLQNEASTNYTQFPSASTYALTSVFFKIGIISNRPTISSYMSTKHFGDGAVHAMFSPYESPYQAFTNYMNVLADFIVRVEEQFPLTIENEELNALLTTIKNQESEIEMLNKELRALKAAKIDAEVNEAAPKEKKSATKKTAAKKAPAKKAATKKDAK